ncbi:WXG100 family type VII secretion target [Streptomyces sp. NPDC001970]
MLAMLASANPETIKEHADQLTDAAKTITEIGEDLKAYVNSVVWKGDAAEAFATWGEQASLATIKLGEYSAVGGSWMSNAAQTLREVKASLPEVDASAKENLDAALKYHNDPDARTVAQDARAKLDGDHAEAVQQMNKLAQSYTFSAMFINAAEPPMFPAPPADFVPQGSYVDGDDRARPGTYSQGGSSSGSDYSPSAPGGPSGHGVGNGHVLQTSAGTVPPHADRPVGLGIDSVGTLPPPTQQSPSITPGSLPSAGRPDGGITPPIVMPPLTGSNQAVSGGRPAGATGRTPALPSHGPLGTGPGTARVPRESGITGGRPVPQNTGRPTGGLPRGMVVGNEGIHGRTPTGGTSAGSIHGPTGGQNGIAAGRRLAYETGGVVGGRPGQQPGATGSRPFTPGGTGLVRNGAEGGTRAGAGQGSRSGMMPHSTHGAGRNQDERREERPDHLVEDEETWQRDSRRVVPPVID